MISNVILFAAGVFCGLTIFSVLTVASEADDEGGNMKALILDSKTDGALPVKVKLDVTETEVKIIMDDLVIKMSRDDIETAIGLNDDGR